MRNILTTIIVTSLLLFATHANADQETVAAIEQAGGTLTAEEAAALKDIQCKKPNPKEDFVVSDSCQSLVDQIAALVAKYSGDENMVNAILTGAVNSHPELSQQFADAAMAASPDNIAQIAALMIDLAPTAAGIANPTALAAISNIPTPPGGGGSLNIPTPPGGGDSSSPN